MKKITTLLALLVFASNTIVAQKWTEMMRDTNANFYDIVKEFDSYWKDRPYEKGKGYKAFRRWQWFAEPRVYPSGNMRYASRGYALEKYNEFIKENSNKKFSNNNQTNAITANWTPLGPFGSPTNGDAGRVQAIVPHPTNPNTFYVGAAAGGFWTTTNNGASYSTSTDLIASLGVSDIAIDPINPLIIYISTGDRDAGDTHSTGVLKSTDGGLTWNTTGLVWQTSQQRRIHRLLINPQNPNTLILASTVGVFRSLDAGATWTMVFNGSFVDAEYKPGDTTTVYVVTNGSFARSTNGGTTFSYVTIANNLNSTRLSMAVTAGNNAYVYILVGATNNGFGGLYRSINSGSNFSLMSNTPNIMDWSGNGSGVGGQAWYDIAIDANPVSPNEIVCGGVNSWRSTNGGSTWALLTSWTGAGGRPYVHADLHVVKYFSGTTCYLGTDGGAHRGTNNLNTWTTVNGNMNIAQIYKMGMSTTQPGRIICGHQDNGSNLSNGVNWSEVNGGDGMDCFIDWNNNNTMVCSQQNGLFRRSINGGAGWTTITGGLTGTAPWVSPIVQDPITPTTYYCGYTNVWRSVNQGSSWTQISTFGNSVDEIKVSPSTPGVIYATTSGSVWKTINGGTSWSNVTGTMAIGPGAITDLAMDNNNPNNIYVSVSGYNAGAKVFASYDGGGTWMNYSAGLPNIPHNCIVYVKNSPQALYVGTDVGIYYREGSMTSWMPYMSGLPNVVVDDMEIYYATGKLRAATYGRGVWETDLYSNAGVVPTGAFYNNFSPACINTPLVFNDLSSNTPTAWVWSFPGGSPANASQQNPTVTFSATGIYTVTLVATNSVGASTPYISTISVVGNPTVTGVSNSVCIGQTGNIGVLTNGNVVKWSTGQQGMTIGVFSTVNAVYTFSVQLGACTTVGTASLFVNQVPPTPSIALMPGYLTTTVIAGSYQWYLNGSPIPGATSPTYAPTADGYYSVWVGEGNCLVSSAVYNYSEIGIEKISAMAAGIFLSPNPVNEALTVEFHNTKDKEIQYEIQNSLGQVIIKSVARNDNHKIHINTQQLAAGVYYLNVITDGKMTASKFVKQ